MSLKKDNKLLEWDRAIWQTGNYLFGFDEAGYGCLAGSMFVAGVIFEPLDPLPESLLEVKDSKKLTETKRYVLAKAIRKHTIHTWVYKVTPEEINTGNVYWLRYEAAAREAKKIARDHPNITIVFDGNRALPLEKEDSRFLIKGDSHSFTIAAASILAKSAKDLEMIELDKKHPNYFFAKNKGYGTKEHQNALLKYGLTPEHRLSYCRKYV